MIKKLEKWLKKEGNTHQILADSLGYSSQSTIYNWIARRSIPKYQYANLKAIFKK